MKHIQKQSIKSFLVIGIGFVLGALNLLILFPRILSKEQIGLTRLIMDLGLVLDELGFILAGESRRQIIGDNRAPVDLPKGWPYDLITQIVTIKVAEVVVEASEQAP